jgi:hypothetical protein
MVEFTDFLGKQHRIVCNNRRKLAEANEFLKMFKTESVKINSILSEYPVVMGQWQARNGQLYTDLGAANQIGMWVTRRDIGTTVTVAYPDNAAARESVAQYVDLMKMMYLRAAEGRADTLSSPRIPKASV